MNIEIITAPLIGGMIGLITNSLAIKMLFRPYKEIRIAGVHVPFTPGLIPKEKARIARAVSQVISNYILDNDTILASLASEKIQKAYEQKYDEKMAEWKQLDSTCAQLLEKYQLRESADKMEVQLRDSVSAYLIEQCRQEDVVRRLITYAFEELKDNLNPLVYKIGKSALNAAKESMIAQLERLIAEQGKEKISAYIDGVYGGWLEKPVCEIAELFEAKAPDLKLTLWQKYTEFIKNKSGQFLSTLNIQSIVENKINEYDLEELEKMIMEISKKELNALVWLGGLLGVIMGFVNLLF